MDLLLNSLGVAVADVQDVVLKYVIQCLVITLVVLNNTCLVKY